MFNFKGERLTWHRDPPFRSVSQRHHTDPDGALCLLISDESKMDNSSANQQRDTRDLSEYGDDLSMEALMKRVDEFQMMEEQGKIEGLEADIAALRHQISCYQRSWRATLDLVREAFEAALLIQTSLRTCDEEEERANKDWLAFWGIHMEAPSKLDRRPVEWPRTWI